VGLKEDIETETRDIFKTRWTERDGNVVPEPEDLGLGNDAVKLEGTVLYADLADSTGLVSRLSAQLAAEIYKAYLKAVCRVIRSNGGTITAFDGDRVMAVFVGKIKNGPAATTALQVNHVVEKVINPLIEEHYPNKGCKITQAVGVDTSTLYVARTGIRGSNDLVWVGMAANLAAKLCSIRDPKIKSWVTKAVFDGMRDDAKLSSDNPPRPMWEKRTWTAYKNLEIYGSSWTWSV